MRERLIQYVDLLFTGAPGAEDIKQEILQNTLDRFDDLVSQGKSEEAAYRLAISGIGDINEILAPMHESAPQVPISQQEIACNPQHRKLRAVAIAMYICSAIPLFILGDLGYGTIGLCLTILLVAAATYLILLSRKPGDQASKEKEPQDPRKKLVGKIVDSTAAIIYLIISFATQAWHITWLIFPIAGCVEGLVNAIYDLKEACQNED
jgi:hypothetical protein